MTDIDTIANRQFVTYMVSKVMFCEASQVILDQRRAVVLTGEGITTRVVTCDVWDEMAPRALEAMAAAGLTPEVYDGRVLFG